ncbi:MAG: M23 family metallopeptidase, partial [Deltaproteobacteria bacterium]|nr:M23 family metallopeptidase [Deltaproteobacteria bacterium]
RLRIEAGENTPARATADGVVIFAGERRGSHGLSLAILHPNGWISLYSGLDEAALRAGDEVLRGAWLGRFGSRDLRFELWQSGHRVDPGPLLVGVPPGD